MDSSTFPAYEHLRAKLKRAHVIESVSGLLGWLRQRIHHGGRRHDTLALVKRVTGEPLSPPHLLRYLRERYLPRYVG